MHQYKPILFILTIFIHYSAFAQTDNLLQQKADSLHRKILILDSHVDTPMKFYANPQLDLNDDNPSTRVDFSKMEKGSIDAVFFAVFLEQGDRDDIGYKMAKNKALFLFSDILKRVVNTDKILFVSTPKDVYKAKYQGKKAVLVGIENGYCIGRDLKNIDEFKKLGVSYITLSHTKNNDICDSSTDKPEHNGLSDFGIKIVREMNRLGIMIDVSHVSDKTIRDVIRYSITPIIASHSCVRALANHPRNLSDDMIKLIARNGGVIQISLVSRFLKPSIQGQATVVDLVNHIDYVVKLVGVDYVGIGSDFDGGGGIIGCRNASEYKNITVELLRRGYCDKDIEKIWSSNLLRVMTDVHRLAQ